MSKTASINAATTKKLVHELERFDELKTQILKLIPEDMIPYGSRLWWEKSELEADEDIRKGNVVKLKSIDDLDKPLKDLFR